MNRTFWIIAIALVALVATGPSQIVPQDGQAYAKSKGKPKLKTCRSRLPSGKIKTWRCKANQPCCVNHTMSIYVCGSPIIGCF